MKFLACVIDNPRFLLQRRVLHSVGKTRTLSSGWILPFNFFIRRMQMEACNNPNCRRKWQNLVSNDDKVYYITTNRLHFQFWSKLKQEVEYLQIVLNYLCSLFYCQLWRTISKRLNGKTWIIQKKKKRIHEIIMHDYWPFNYSLCNLIEVLLKKCILYGINCACV